MYLERRALPKANKITYARSVARDQGLHAARLATMKPSIDITAPAEHRHLRRNKKREQMMEGERAPARARAQRYAEQRDSRVSVRCGAVRAERYSRIEHENRLLLSKMSDIMQRQAMDTDNVETVQYSHSLNRLSRKKALERISAENQAILRRIQAREPVINHLEFEAHRVEAEKYLNNIMEYKGSGGMRSAPGGSRVLTGACFTARPARRRCGRVSVCV